MGYINNKEEKTIEIDPEVAPLIRTLFKLFSTGNFSLLDLRRKVKADGMLDGFTKYKVSRSSIHKVLQNPVYYGKVLFKDELFDGNHEPIVTEALFFKVQETLRARLHPFKRTKDRFTFTGTFQCSKCGCAISAEMRKGKYIYYHCTQMRGACDNTQKSIREEVLEQQFLTLLQDIQIDEERMEWVKDRLRSSHDQEKFHHKQTIKELNQKIDKIQDRLNKAYEDKLDGNITESFWQQKFKEWTEERQSLTRELSYQQNRNKNYFEKGMKVLELASKAHNIYLNQGKEGRQKLIRFILQNNPNQNSPITGKKASFELKKPFSGIIESKKSKNWLGFVDCYRTYLMTTEVRLVA